MRTPTRGAARSRLILFFSVVIIIVVCGELFMPSKVKERIADRLPEDFSFLWLAQLYLALFIGRYIAVAVHEVGHALAGRWRGLRFSFMTVGRIWISNVDGHLRVRKNPGLMVRGGLCASFPGDKEPTQSDLRWFILCGPLASVVLAAAAFGWLYATRIEPDFARMTVWMVASLSVWYGLASLLFTKTPANSPWMSDGAQLKALRSEPAHFHDMLALMNLTGLCYTGVRPREWPKPLVNHVATSERIARQMTSMRVAVLSDEQNYREALKIHTALMEDFESQHPTMQKVCALTQSYLLVMADGSASEARAWFAKGADAPTDKHRIVTAEAAVLIAEGEATKALSLLEQVPALQQNTLVPISDYDTSLTNELVAMATAAQAHRPTAEAAVD